LAKRWQRAHGVAHGVYQMCRQLLTFFVNPPAIPRGRKKTTMMSKIPIVP
jgi:hypothetical protein